MTRNPFFAACLLLAACGPGAKDPVSGLVDRLHGDRPPAQTEEYLALDRAPAIAAVLEDRNAADVLHLKLRRDGVDLWLGSDGTTLRLRDGLLVATRGIGGDLMAADVSQTRALLQSRRDGTVHRFHSYLDGNEHVVTRSFVCDIEHGELFAFQIGAHNVELRHVREACNGMGISFTNHYWLEPGSGRILRSRQFISVYAGMLALQTAGD